MRVKNGIILAIVLAAARVSGVEDMPILKWMGDEEARRATKNVVMKILREDPALSYRAGAAADQQNLLVHGDNLDALMSLLPLYAGRVKCIYIDPPYNTGSAFEHYDDSLEHSTWLNMMYPRLKLLREFLSEDGSIWITLDDGENHYCKVICDEIFGRGNFLVDITWQHSVQPKGYLDKFSIHHNHTLLYQKSHNFKLNPLERQEKDNKAYSNPDNDPKGLWRSGDVRNALYRPNLIYDIVTPSGKIIKPCKNGWRWSKDTVQAKIASGEIVFSKDETRIIRKIYLSTVGGRAPESIWFGEDVGTTREAMSEIKEIFAESTFETPKPERLIQRILTIATNPGDLVLDSFLGSGTTAAVAHKMGRRWIGIEMGEHAKTHCAVRLKKVVDGEPGGISKAVRWQGGGGFRFYELGETVLKPDGTLTEDIPFETMAAHVWFTETKRPYDPPSKKTTVLGVDQGAAYALLYNGILMDRSVNGGNVLTKKTLKVILEDLAGRDYEKIVVYAEASRLSEETLVDAKITFRQTPYDLIARK